MCSDCIYLDKESPRSEPGGKAGDVFWGGGGAR